MSKGMAEVKECERNGLKECKNVKEWIRNGVNAKMRCRIERG